MKSICPSVFVVVAKLKILIIHQKCFTSKYYSRKIMLELYIINLHFECKAGNVCQLYFEMFCKQQIHECVGKMKIGVLKFNMFEEWVPTHNRMTVCQKSHLLELFLLCCLKS